MSKSEYIMMFLKFGSEENMTSLYEKGTIYMKSLNWFRNHKDESGHLRGDSYEGIKKVINFPSGEIEISSVAGSKKTFKHKLPHLGLHAIESYEELTGNLYCLYSISNHWWEKASDIKIDSLVSGFGTHCLVIKNVQKFMTLLEDKLHDLKLKFGHGFVDYYDERSGEREFNLFEKRKIFEYQREFRFYVESDNSEDVCFEIGSLKDVAELHLTEQVINTLTFKHKDDV